MSGPKFNPPPNIWTMEQVAAQLEELIERVSALEGTKRQRASVETKPDYKEEARRQMCYEFCAAGAALDAVIVVFASEYEEAVALAREWCVDNKWITNPNSLRLVHETPVRLDKPCVLYSWDGNY